MWNIRENSKHLLPETATIKDALSLLNKLDSHLTVFIVDNESRLIGSMTDGDIRRGLLNNVTITDSVSAVMNRNFRFLRKGFFSVEEIQELKAKLIKLVPMLDDDRKLLRIINLDEYKSVLPLDAIIMAGGEGKRLRPLTSRVPKPLLPVGGKPIIEHNVHRLEQFGIERIYITLNYLGDQLRNYFHQRESNCVQFNFIEETHPLGTIGSVKLISEFNNEHVLVMNSDLLTNIDYEDFYVEFCRTNADMAVATIPYKVDIPYAVLETEQHFVKDFKEKPTYTYYSNAGIYILKRAIIDLIPENSFFNATDLMESLIRSGKKVLSYPLVSYWLDIGKHDDYKKAQEDIKHIKF